MKPSNIKSITTALEAKGYQVYKNTSSWNGKIFYVATHKNGVRIDFAPADNKTTQTLIDEKQYMICHFHNEIRKYESLIAEELVDMDLFNHEYSKMKLDEIWSRAKKEYEESIQSHIESIKDYEEVIADLQELLGK